MTLPPQVRARLDDPVIRAAGVTAGALASVVTALALGVATAQQSARLADARRAAPDAQALLARVPQEAQALGQADDALRAVEERVRAGRSTARVLEALDAAAQERQLTMQAVQSASERRQAERVSLGPGMALERSQLAVTVTGSYRALAEFLDALQAMPCLVSVQELAVRAADGASTVTAALTLGLYMRP